MTDNLNADLFKKVLPLVEFVQKYGRLPKQSGADLPVDEEKAGNILRALRRRARTGERFTAELVAYLNENVPGWLTENIRPAARGMRAMHAFKHQAYQAHRFYERHGKLPSARSASSREAALGRFLRNHRQAVAGRGTTSWTPQKERLLDKLLPGWDLGLRTRLAAQLVAAAM